jgi:hypothetical protein
MNEDADEKKLAVLAKRMLAMPHKHRDESKLGRKPAKKPKAKRRKASMTK